MLKRKMAMFSERESYGDGRKWFRGPLIGRGRSCSVFVSNLKPNLYDDDHELRERMAVKSTKDPQYLPLLRGEEYILEYVLKGVPSIVQCLGYEETLGKTGERAYNLLLEYGDGGSLRALIRRNFRRGLPEEEVRIYTKCIAEGLYHIHGRGYMHRDLRPDNIILFENDCTHNNEGEKTKYIAKICDFGCAKDYTKIRKMKVEPYLRGNIRYLSPEAAFTNRQGPEGDIWALGCIVFEMLTGETVWRMTPDFEIERVLVAMGSGVRHYGKIPGRLSDVSVSFMESCFQTDPKCRHSAKGLLEHPFIKEV